MTCIRVAPCDSCPYRRDVPSGIWAEEEYEKLRGYDEETGNQPWAAFMCHTTPESYCHGWGLVHDAHRLLALRLSVQWDGIVPDQVAPLFSSGNEAADHGETEINTVSPAAMRKIDRVQKKRGFP